MTSQRASFGPSSRVCQERLVLGLERAGGVAGALMSGVLALVQLGFFGAGGGAGFIEEALKMVGLEALGAHTGSAEQGVGAAGEG